MRVARWLRRPRPFQPARSGVPFCDQVAVHACRKDANARWARPARRQSGCPGSDVAQQVHHRRRGNDRSANGRTASGAPCCSNWLVTQPSIVNVRSWRTRGELVDISSPFLCKNISTARSPTRSRLPGHFSGELAKPTPATRSRRGQGEREIEMFAGEYFRKQEKGRLAVRHARR